jgi:hypothetical protein
MVIGGLAASLALGSCQPPRTQLLVVLDTDIPECRFMDIHLSCAYNWDALQGPPPNPACDYPFRRGDSSATIHLPVSFGVTYNDMFPNDPVTIEVDNASGDLTPTLRRIVRVPFVQHQTRQVVIRLVNACLANVASSTSTPCPTGLTTCTLSQSCEARQMTCGNDGTCRAIDITTNELQGGDAGFPDSGPIDASTCE